MFEYDTCLFSILKLFFFLCLVCAVGALETLIMREERYLCDFFLFLIFTVLLERQSLSRGVVEAASLLPEKFTGGPLKHRQLNSPMLTTLFPLQKWERLHWQLCCHRAPDRLSKDIADHCGNYSIQAWKSICKPHPMEFLLSCQPGI